MKLDRKKVELIKLGDKKTFDEVYLTYYKLVKYIIFDIVKNHEDADDLSQEVFVKVFQKIDTFIPNTEMTPWISSIAKNTAIDFLKNKNSKVSIILLDTPDVVITVEENADCISDAVDEKMKNILDEDEYFILVHKLYLELKFTEIADMLGTNVAKVAGKYYRAIKKLKKELKREDFYD